MLKSNPLFKKTELIDCHFSQRTIASSILKFDPSLLTQSNKELNNMVDLSSSLTYLKLFVGSTSRSYIMYAQEIRSSATKIGGYIFTQCPHLTHLFLDGQEARIDLGYCASIALRKCPRLKTLVLGNNAEIPKTIISDMNNNDSDGYDSNNNHGLINNKNSASSQKLTSSSSATTSDKGGGLRQFVVLHTHIHENQHTAPDSYFQRTNRNHWNQCFSTFNKCNRDSLELLYVLCNTITIQGLHQWCGYGVAPNLREIYLADKPLFQPLVNTNLAGSTGYHSNGSLLGKLIPCFPSLEVLIIIQTFNTPYEQYIMKKQDAGKKPYYTKEQLVVDDNGLKQLIKHCRRIRYIKIIGHHYWTRKAILSLAQEVDFDNLAIGQHSISSSSSTTAKLPINYLEMDIPRDIVLQVVKGMDSLKDLKVRMDRDIIKELDSINPNDQYEAESILHERGGSMTITNEYDNTFMYYT
ncbi:hypothetical protein BDA99DRAFT_9717 [Phascolomyces articulosus]|uniref:Uncharacterized protein n=1 Tax=Phascolomyces articulosus TaxID=60185 RepID=A0AAD5KRJ5_9FUNG|nr:hypothetical protein BDA99DRAFT_9717 [Phascolomyces articulosus]